MLGNQPLSTGCGIITRFELMLLASATTAQGPHLGCRNGGFQLCDLLGRQRPAELERCDIFLDMQRVARAGYREDVVALRVQSHCEVRDEPVDTLFIPLWRHSRHCKVAHSLLRRSDMSGMVGSESKKRVCRVRRRLALGSCAGVVVHT